MCRNIRYIVLLFLLPLAFMLACQRHNDDLVETRHGTSRIEQVPEPVVPEQGRRVEGPSPELSAIDSLMWRQPDSALACLIPYFDTCCRDAKFCVSTTTTFNRHYANLLLSELLYKNDYAQANRPALLQAVTYFDSIMQVPEPVEGPSFKRNAFLDSRAHYINGVGYYENDSVVPACAEYLKALEVMESHFEEKELVGGEARFMTYTYSRLGYMFEEQMLAEPAITCYKQALHYSKIEPTSKYGIPTLLYNLGILFDVVGTKDSAAFYYDKALTLMPDNNNIHYRDILTSKALFAYNSGFCIDSVIKELKYVISLAVDENEKTTRFLTLGNILYENKQFDSSRFYLETVFEQQDDIPSKIVAAQNLCSIYQTEGDSVKVFQYSSFLADFAVMEIEKKSDVSKINEMFQTHLNQKQEKLSKEAREKSIRKTIGIIVPIAISIVLVIVVLARLRRKKLMKEQQNEADRVLGDTKRKHQVVLARQEEEAKKAFEEAEKQHELMLQQQQTEAETLLEEKERQLEKERKARQREKEKLQQGLQQRENQVSALEKALGSQREEAELRREAFMNEAICRKINDSVRSLHITARNSHEKYVSFTEEDAAALKAAVLKHYGNFESVLMGKYPKLSNDDLQLCQLYLMGLDERQIAVLQNKSYSAIKKRANTLKGLLGLDENLSAYLLKSSSFQKT